MTTQTLKQMRSESGLRTSKVIDVLGISRTQLYNIENGKSNLDDSKAIKLCLLYKKNIEEVKNAVRGK